MTIPNITMYIPDPEQTDHGRYVHLSKEDYKLVIRTFNDDSLSQRVQIFAEDLLCDWGWAPLLERHGLNTLAPNSEDIFRICVAYILCYLKQETDSES